MPSKSIPPDVKKEVEKIVKEFNKRELADSGQSYCVRFRGQYAYLNRDDGCGPGPICRLEYTGNIKEWEFAIYKYSSERYDPEEWMFPGIDSIDGTIEGAMKAGMEAYP